MDSAVSRNRIITPPSTKLHYGFHSDTVAVPLCNERIELNVVKFAERLTTLPQYKYYLHNSVL